MGRRLEELERCNRSLRDAQSASEHAVRESEQRYRLLFQGNPQPTWVYDLTTLRILDVNDEAVRHYGYSREEFLAMTIHDLFSADDTGHICMDGRGREGRRVPQVCQHRTKDGSTIYVELSSHTLVFSGRRAEVVLANDITTRKEAEDALWENREQYRSLIDNIDFGFTLIDENHRILMTNASQARMFNRDEAEFIGKECFRELAGQEVACPACPGTIAMKSGKPAVLEKEGIKHDGTRFTVRIKAFPIFDPDGAARKFCEVVEDITERKRVADEIQQLAYYDTLTGLPNRTLLKDRLQQLLAHAQRHGERVGVIFLDLDRFKEVNDTQGHAIGDELLKAAARRLTKSVRATDTVARLGGDEFVIVISEINHEQDVTHIAQKIMRSLQPPFLLEGKEIFSTASMGIALFPLDGSNAGSLLRSADTAMYAAKENGRNNYQFFSNEMNQKVVERLELENSLRRALERDEFYLLYQPQVNGRTGGTTSVEALLRWNHPEMGPLLPNRFIPVAEDTGLIIEIGEWVLRTACRQAKSWHDAGFSPLRVAVNLSGRQFRQHNLLKMVERVLAETGLHPSGLELEITESMLMESGDFAVKTLVRLKGLGVFLSVDDFGTGYSSLNYLKRFPLNRLKIDQSFVRDITRSASDAAITDAIIALARSLGMGVIAEGVERREQALLLLEKDCVEMQGHYFCVPLSAAEIPRFLAQGIGIVAASPACSGAPGVLPG
ncbi:MAG TPA: EAL domain-containing protein [Geobacteraceae bacterium]